MVFTDLQKQIIASDNSVKSVRLTFPNHEIDDIENDQIYLEEMSLEESLLDQDTLKIGKCNGGIFTIKVADFTEDILNAEMDVDITFTNEELGEVIIPHGKYIINTAPERTSDRRWRIIKATDFMSKFDVDIADWYNSTLFPTNTTTKTVKQIRDALCTYIGVTPVECTLPNDSLVVGKYINPTQLKGRDFLEQICEINCCFGHFDCEGHLNFYTPGESLTPSLTLYPSNELYPEDGTSEVHSVHVYKNCQYADYDIAPINSISIFTEDGDIGQTYTIPNVDRVNPYSVIGNVLLFGLSDSQLTQVAQTMCTSLASFSFRPIDVNVPNCIFLELGDSIKIRVYSISGSEVTSQLLSTSVLKRELKGIQAINVNVSASGSQYQPEVNDNVENEYKILNGKSAKYKRDIDGISLELQNFEDQTASQFIQTSSEIQLAVSKTDDVWDTTGRTIKAQGYHTPVYDSNLGKYKVTLPFGDTSMEGLENYGDEYLDLNTGKWYKFDTFGATTSQVTYTFTVLVDNQLPKKTSELAAAIQVNANNINLKVSKDSVISEINQSAEQITINANKISLEGLTTINDNFKVNLDGSIECASGTFKGTFRVLDDSDNAVIYLDNSGNAVFNGQVQSTSGKIANWNISGNYLYSDVDYGGNGLFKAFIQSDSNAGKDTWVFSTQRSADRSGNFVGTSYITYSGDAYFRGDLQVVGTFTTGSSQAVESYIDDGVAYFPVSVTSPLFNGRSSTTDTVRALHETNLGYSQIYMRSNGQGGSPYFVWGSSQSNPYVLYPYSSWSSDERIKKNIKAFDSKFEKFFMDLKPVSFKYKDSDDNKDHLGFIAQQVQKSMENNGIKEDEFYGLRHDDFTESEEGLELFQSMHPGMTDMYSLDYEQFIALNTHMIQKALREIEELKQRLGGN